MHEQRLLVVMVPGEVRDPLVDELIAMKDISGFSMTPSFGYSRDHSRFSTREQVEGYQQMYRFEVLHEPDQAAQLLETLGAVCGQLRPRYWVLQPVDSGHLGTPGQTA